MSWISFLKDKRIAILVGHLDKDSGAVDPPDALEHDEIDTKEVELNLALSRALYGVIALSAGHAILLGGTLLDRCEKTNAWNPNVALSIHTNSFTNTEARGDEVLYGELHDNATESKRLAQIVEGRLAQNLPEISSRGVKVRNNLFVLKHVMAPICMIEAGFITNPREERILWDEGYRLRWAAEVAVALRDFLAV